MVDNEIIGQRILENKNKLYALAYSIIGHPEDAEDAVGNAIIKAFMHKGNIKKDDSIDAWLYSIVNREAYGILRTRKPIVSLDENENLCSRDIISEKVDKLYIWDVVSQMDEKYRGIVYLYYGLQMDTHQISKIVGIPQGTVRTRLKRAREILRVTLEEGGEVDAK